MKERRGIEYEVYVCVYLLDPSVVTPSKGSEEELTQKRMWKEAFWSNLRHLHGI
jgi:hypothetical protein